MVPEIPNGDIIRYELTIYSSSLGASGMGNFNLTSQTLEYKATMLSPFTNYTFEVAAVTGAGRGDCVMIMDITDESGMLFTGIMLS